ncbi:hypothetical protein B4U80_01044, partial [Leptotrombidium deliense]
FLSYFGGTLFEALDFGFPENVDRVLDPKLEHLIELLTETYDYNDENDSNDEGIEQDSPDDNEYRDKILQLCVSRLSPNENAECHYKQICKELVTETLELKTLLEKITTGQKELQKTSFIVNSNAKVNKINSNLGDVKLTDWATPWLQVIREFKRGVRLKPVCFNNVNSRIEHKLLPYEILLDDIRMKRYKLNKVMINGDVPQGVKKDVHDLTLEFIRSKPALVPASKRPLAPRPEEQQTLYEKLMHSIRQPHKLKSTPLSSAKHSPVYLGRVMQGGKNNPKVDTPISHRRVIKPNLTLRLSISSEDEEELNSEEWTNCSPESYGNNDSETKKSEESNVMLESDFEKDQKCKESCKMCGILAILGSKTNKSDLRKRALLLSSKLRHRGPDWKGIYLSKNVTSNFFINFVCVNIAHLGIYVNTSENEKSYVICHERLGIVDPVSGSQPLLNESETLVLAVNGEIYNHRQIRAEQTSYNFKTNSDCEVIIPLYERYGNDCVQKLDGDYAFVIYDSRDNSFFAARDPIGVVPLYIGWGKDGSLWFASELKAIDADCESFQEFPPGHYWSSKQNEFVRWYNAKWYDEHIPNDCLDLSGLRQCLERSVIKRMMCDVPYGVLLSGGLDSSLVASLVCRHALQRTEDDEKTAAWWPRVHTFSIGLKGSPDLKAAKEVADFLKTVHHEFHFTVQEGIDALYDVIYHLETYDVTTIRASTPMFLLSRKIKALGIKMVLSGEGADEMFGGYLYFHHAPSKEEFHVETCKKLKLLSKYDCLRANKSSAAWGVEVRVPFLDKDFLDFVMSVDPKEKMVNKEDKFCEKWILRKAFDDETNPYLPKSVLWRQKEQFSDGVGYEWINSLKKHAENEITDEQFNNAKYTFPYNTPTTKEAYLYRTIFCGHFPKESAAKTVLGGPSIACSTPAAIEWMENWKNNADPSGRAISGVHLHAQ